MKLPAFKRFAEPIKFIRPDGASDEKADIFELSDAGETFYVQGLAITKVPTEFTFGITLTPYLHWPHTDTKIYARPIPQRRAIKRLKDLIRGAGSDIITEQKNGNTVRVEEMMERREVLSNWRYRVAARDTQLFEVQYLFMVYGETEKELKTRVKKLVARGEQDGFTIRSTCWAQKEAFMSIGPYCNTIHKEIFSTSFGSVGIKYLKESVLDSDALSTIFPHTTYNFSHDSGIPIGASIDTGQMFTYDIFAKGKDGYSLTFSGITGSGKTVLTKISAARYANLFDAEFACVDSKMVNGRGEYSSLCNVLGGVNFELGPQSDNRLNLFQLRGQYDKDGQKVVENLHLLTHVSNCADILRSIAAHGKSELSVEVETAFLQIAKKCILNLYERIGVREGDWMSLYDENRNEKPMPTMSDLYLEVSAQKAVNTIEEHKPVYTLMIDMLADCVDGLCFNPKTFERCEPGSYGCEGPIYGTKGYLDGQSSVIAPQDCPFINIDISQISLLDRPIVQLIALAYIQEQFINTNRDARGRQKPRVVIVDEAHRMLKEPRATSVVDDIIRTCRTQKTSVWLVTQSIADFKDIANSESILKNMSAIFLLKHKPGDVDYIESACGLTPKQALRVTHLGGNSTDARMIRKGECCVIENNRCAFIQAKLLDQETIFAESDENKLMEYQRRLIETL